MARKVRLLVSSATARGWSTSVTNSAIGGPNKGRDLPLAPLAMALNQCWREALRGSVPSEYVSHHPLGYPKAHSEASPLWQDSTRPNLDVCLGLVGAVDSGTL